MNDIIDLKKSQQEEPTVLKQLRDELGMKQEDFAVWLGVTVSTISRCENAKTEMMLTARQWHKLFSRVKYRLGIDVLDMEPIDLSSRISVEQLKKISQGG